MHKDSITPAESSAKIVHDILDVAEKIADCVIPYTELNSDICGDEERNISHWNDREYMWSYSEPLGRIVINNYPSTPTWYYDESNESSISDEIIIIELKNGKWIPSISYHWGNENGKGPWHSIVTPNVEGNEGGKLLVDEKLLNCFWGVLNDLLYRTGCGGIATEMVGEKTISTISDFTKVPEYNPVLLTSDMTSNFMRWLHDENKRGEVDTRPFLLEELGELSQIVARTYRRKREVKASDIASEIADVIICTDAFCTQYGIPRALVAEAIRKKMERHIKRSKSDD